MNRKPLLIGILVFVGIIVTAGLGVAYGQEESTPIEDVDDTTTTVIIISAVIGGLAAPIFGYATQQKESAQGANSDFNWRQYIIAVLIVIPGTMGLILAEVMMLNMQITNMASVVVLFIMVFTQAIGLDYGKSRAKRAIGN